MKHISTIFFLLFPVVSIFGQTKNIFPDTFPNTPGIKSVIVKETCLTCPDNQKERISEKFFFNDSGQNVEWVSICENKPCGKQNYYYENGSLVSYTNRSTWVSTSTTGDFGMQWDSTLLTNKLEYFYEKNVLVKTIWTDGQTNSKSLEIRYEYDDLGRLKIETIIDFPDPNTIGTFEPNSTELIDDEDLKNQIELRKEYNYSDSTTTIRYFKKGILTGIETKTKNKKGELLKSYLKDANGKIIQTVTNTYELGLLKQKVTSEIGYDGFGNPYDFLGYDKESYEYDNKGNLTETKLYSKGQVQLVKKYEYKK